MSSFSLLLNYGLTLAILVSFISAISNLKLCISSRTADGSFLKSGTLPELDWNLFAGVKMLKLEAW